MYSQQFIRSVIEHQTEGIKQKPLGLKRGVLSDVAVVDGFATIIMGIRRCGKSTLLLQKMASMEGAVSYLNFEDPRLAGFETDDLSRLTGAIAAIGNKIVCLDEIQLVKGWEILVHQLLRDGYFVFITGSNASLLSQELGTHLTGRHLSMELFPFSYPEYLAYRKQVAGVASFADYMQKGGMPDYLRTQMDVYLNALLDDILMRDIAIRHGVKDIRSLRQLAVYLLSNVGNLVSANRLEGMFGIKSNSTILAYFSYLTDAYLLDFVPMFDYSLKKQQRNPRKIYALDLGIQRQNSASFTPDLGHLLENAVYVCLRHQYKDIFYYQNDGECDFVVTRKDVPVAAYQVCYKLTNENLDREMKGLLSAMQSLGLKSGAIITESEADQFHKDGMTVDVIPAYRFATENEN